ncbi:MAG: NUDIX domain-containing protein [Deltaproteobacteria bacterium]|nr:NUDIX domain-containing protein [Deltaproteobacteria bacterium]
MKRRYPDQPLVGVAGLVFKEEAVLLVRRARPPAVGQWSIPGGLVELGESLTTAVAREIMEETNLRVGVGPVVKVVERLKSDLQGRVVYHYVVVDYLCRLLGGELEAASDAAQARWVGPAEMDALGLPAETRTVIDKARLMAKRGVGP